MVVVIRRANFAALTAACGRALVDELSAYERIYFADHRTLTHAERSRDGVRARPALAFLPRAENQVGVNLKLVVVQAQREDIVVKFEVVHKKLFCKYCFDYFSYDARFLLISICCLQEQCRNTIFSFGRQLLQLL